MHPRQAIRNAAAAALASVGPTVYQNRVEPFISTSWQEDLPAINVFVLDESARVFADAGNRMYERVAQLAVEITVTANANTDNVLDNLAELVENAITQDDSLAATCSQLVLVSSRLGIKSEGEHVTGACLILWEAYYYDSLPRTSNLPDLTGITTEVRPHD
jgi:hypothetical protein